MWKKILILLLGLVGTFSVVYANQNELFASQVTYTAGANVTGRINIAPANLEGTKASIGFKSGDKIAIGADAGNAWQLGTLKTYDTYNCGVQIMQTTKPTRCTNTPINAWVSLSVEPLAKSVIMTDQTSFSTPPWIVSNTNTPIYGLKPNHNGMKALPYSKMGPTKYVEEFNTLMNNSGDMKLVTNVDEAYLFNRIKDVENNPADSSYFFSQAICSYGPDTFGKKAIVPSNYMMSALPQKARKYNTQWWINYAYVDVVPKWSGNKVEAYNAEGQFIFYSQGATSPQMSNEIRVNDVFNIKSDVRAAAYLDLKEVVFALSDASSNSGGFSKINAVPNDFSTKASHYINDAANYENMVARILDNSMSISLNNDPFYLLSEDRKIPRVDNAHTFIKGKNIKIKAQGSIGGTISAVIFDNSGEPLYYTTLGASTGKEVFYEINTSDLEKGAYQIALVNEKLPDLGNTAPASSSYFSDSYKLSIVEPISNLTFTAASSLEYGKNVNSADTAGVISSQNGAGTPSYRLATDSSYPKDIDHFELDTDGKTVKIKGGALEAGTYHFKIQAQDANGDPSTPLEISASITVAKTSPNLTFSTTNAIDKVIGDTAFTEGFTHKNTDTSDALFKLTYSSSISNVATVDTPSGNTDTDVEITPASVNGTSMIKVELAGTKNFTADSATLTVNVHPKISLSFTPDKNSFAVSEVVNAGTKIGSVSLSGDSPQYEYSMAIDPENPDAGTNNDLFKVNTTGKTNATSMDILTNTPNVPQGTYKITIKAEDAYGQISYAKGTIKIAGMAQTDFEFYDYQNASKVMTNDTLTIYYGEDGAKLFAKGGQSSGLSYAPDNPTQTVLTINPSDGTLVTNDIGKIKVKATKPADGTYSEAVIYMYVEVKPCEQEINFDKAETTTISYDNENGHSFFETATGNIKTGMPNAGEDGVGSIRYTLGGTDKDIASIDASTGEITINAGQNITTMKTFTVTAKLNDGDSKNEKYGSASKTKTINVYPAGSASWTQTNKPQAENNTGTEKIGDLTVTGGSGNAGFAISTSGDADNLDKEFFDIDPTSGEVTLIKQITVADIASKTYNQTEKAYEMHVMVDITDGGNTTTEHLTIYIQGAERLNLDFKNRDTVTQEITETYDVNKSFNLSLNQNISGTTYRISTNPSHISPSDVITVSTNGKADIQNANEVSISGSTTAPVYVEAVVPPSAGYKEMIVEAPVRIKRASQTLVFSQNPINTSADIQSLTITMSGHKDGNNLVYSSSDSKVKALAEPTNSDMFTIKPNGVVKNGITITAIAQGDRNYKDDLKTATLNIAQAGTNQFTAIFPSMTYGDAGPFQVTIAPAGSGNETYTYTVADTNIVEIDANGNITPHHAGSTTVDVTQTSAGGTVGPYTFTITVDPKPITVTIEDKAKYTGMDMPAFTVDIPSADIVTGDMIPIPEFRCVDTNGFDVEANTGAGSYPITGTYPNPPSDYDITLVEGKLAVSQDNGSQSWYELQDIDGNKTSSSVWHKNSVDIVLKPATGSAGTYDQIANDIGFTNKDLTRFTVTEEGETTQDIYFRIDPNGSDPNKGAITLPIQETIRIDNTDPIIKSITAKDNGKSMLKEIMNALTFGKYFKQGTVVTIEAEDPIPKQGMKVSEIASITYTVQKVDKDGNAVEEPTTFTENKSSIDFSLRDIAIYKVCAIATDHAGRTSEEMCKDFEIKKIDVDVDKDGKPDFNDPDGNGCADFNIVYTDEATGEQKVLNVDANRDGIPEMNIDTNGDGEADINVDTDGDGKPDLNLVRMTKELWKPTQCVTQHGEQYESGMDITPQINVDLDIYDPDSDSYHVPDINIDHKGDFQPHINISKDGKTAQVNIAIIHTWNPNKDYTIDGFSYDTLTVDEKKEILMNIDTDGDGRPDINIDLNNDGKPDLNIDTDGDWIPNINIDSIGDGKADINIDTTKDGKPDINVIEIKEWTPKKDVDGKVPYDTMEITGKKELEDNGIIVEKPDGNFLPNTAIKVKDVSDTVDTSIKEKLDSLAGEQEIKKVYDVEYLENNVTKQPDGSVKVKIPVDPLVKNAKVVVEKEDGNFEEVNVTEKDGYYIFETEYIGKVSIIGDVEETKYPTPEPTPEPMPDSSIKHKENPSTSVKGSYTKNTSAVGGAYTGDSTHEIYYYAVIIILSFCILLCVEKRIKNK